MELSRFMQALAKRSDKLDAIETGSCSHCFSSTSARGRSADRAPTSCAFTSLLDIRLAESDAPDELRQVIAGATDAIVAWDADPSRGPRVARDE